MVHLEAGQHPHIITRPCGTRAEAERWAQELSRRGFRPALIDGRRYEESDLTTSQVPLRA